MYVRHQRQFFAHLVVPNKVCLSTGVLDSFLDHIFHFIPIACIDTVDDALEVLLDLAQHLPFIAVGNKRDSHTNATKSTGTTNTVKICLEVGGVGTVAGRVFLRDILKMNISDLPVKTGERKNLRS